MKRHEPCTHLRPDYDRLENAHHIRRHPVTDEISWEPTSMMDNLMALGLIPPVRTIRRSETAS